MDKQIDCSWGNGTEVDYGAETHCELLIGDPNSLDRRLDRLEANLAELRRAVQWLVDRESYPRSGYRLMARVPKMPDWASS